MRRLIAIILLGGVLTHLFYSSGLLIDYYVNSETYKALCENKDKPELKCDGKCILALKIAEARKEKNKDNDATVPPIPTISLQYLLSSFNVSFNISETLIDHIGIWLEPFLKDLILLLFKPPI